MTDYDPSSAEVKENPHKYFDELRATCPVHHHVLPDVDVSRMNANPLVAGPTSEFWSVFRYDDIATIMQDTVTYSRREGPGPERLQPLNEDGMLLYADDPAHMLQRRIVSKAFTPRIVDQLRPEIQVIVDELIDEFADRGELEVINDFSIPLTVMVIAEMVGVPRTKLRDFQRWGQDTIAAFGGDPGALERSFQAMTEFFEYFGAEIYDRRKALDAGGEARDDVLTAMITADYQGTRFTDNEILMAAQQLMTAGFETTSTAVASGVYLLCTHPEERQKFESDPALTDNAVEEVLRYEAPIEGLFCTTNTPVEVAGCPIPAGSKVRMVFASANRDEGHFADAHHFRIDRDPVEMRKHLTFGFGPHACIGAALGRAELRAALTTLFRRLPGLELDPTKPRARNPIMLVNGFASLPIRWDPTKALPAG